MSHAMSLFRVLAIASLLALALPALAGEIRVGPGTALQPVIDAAPAGSIIRLSPGTHDGPIEIRHALTLIGEEGAILAGKGEGSVIEVHGPDVRIEGLRITGSGSNLPGMDSGILARRSAARAMVIGNHLDRNLFGVYLHGSPDSL